MHAAQPLHVQCVLILPLVISHYYVRIQKSMVLKVMSTHLMFC